MTNERRRKIENPGPDGRGGRQGRQRCWTRPSRPPSRPNSHRARSSSRRSPKRPSRARSPGTRTSPAPSRPASRPSTQAISKQLAAVMHNPEFQKLEGTWRGLHYLVMNSETSAQLKLKVLNVSKRELVQGPRPGGRVRPEPGLQEALRERVRHARRRTLRGADRRLRVHEPSRGHRPADEDVERGGGGLLPVHLRRRGRRCSASSSLPSSRSRATWRRFSTPSSTRSGNRTATRRTRVSPC